MAYIEDNLMPDEKVAARAHLHRVVFLWPAIWIALGFWAITSNPGLGLTLIVFGLGLAVLALINYKTSEFAVTNKRVLAKIGFIRRNSLEVLLSKVEGIQVSQGIFGRMLDYGSIVVSGTGGTKERYRSIAAPLVFRRRVQEEAARVQEAAQVRF